MKIFMISLPNSRDRRLSGLSKMQGIGLPFEIVDGVEARSYLPEALPRGPQIQDYQPTVGEVGCYAAHLRALQRIVDYRLPWAIILEDDFCFEPEPDVGMADLPAILPKRFHYIHLQRNLGFNPRLRVLSEEGLFERIKSRLWVQPAM